MIYVECAVTPVEDPLSILKLKLSRMRTKRCAVINVCDDCLKLKSVKQIKGIKGPQKQGKSDVMHPLK